MPVHRQQKDTTPNPSGSTPEQTAPALPEQQFRQYLRELARGAIRIVLEDVMREELDALIGVGWGESSRQQQGLSQRLLHS
jgi:putative transposase